MDHSLEVQYQQPKHCVFIDFSTIKSLELIQNSRTANSKDCLRGLLDSTMTPMGSSLLRHEILQPSTDRDNTIEPRCDAVQELSTNEEMLSEVRNGSYPHVLPARVSHADIEQP